LLVYQLVTSSSLIVSAVHRDFYRLSQGLAGVTSPGAMLVVKRAICFETWWLEAGARAGRVFDLEANNTTASTSTANLQI
jgi:hypothetical protein